MALFPSRSLRYASHTIGTFSPNSIGSMIANVDQHLLTSLAWQTANAAFFFPFTIDVPTTIVQMSWANGATVSGNVDIGIYNSEGTLLVSSGSTAQSGVSANQTVNTTDTLLSPGKWFYLALAVDNTTATLLGVALSAAFNQAMGVLSMASAFPLPATATFASITVTRVWRVTAHTLTLV